MRKTTKTIAYITGTAILFLFFAVVFLIVPLETSAASVNPSVKSYEMAEDTGYFYGDTVLVGNMSFGSPSAGVFSISGEVSKKTSFRGAEAYGVMGAVEFSYLYNNSVLCQEDSEQWEVYSNSDKEVNGISISEKMKKGVIILQKSANKVSWSTDKIVTDIFSNKNTNVLSYTPSEQDLKNGTYYRIIVAYEIRHQSGSFLIFPIHDYKECVEVYEFYLTYDQPFVSISEIISGSELSDEDVVDYGFRIDDGNSGHLISVKKLGSNQSVNVKSGAAFYSPGTYSITETTRLGYQNTTTITVDKGLNVATSSGSVYQSDDNTGYGTSDALKVEQTAFGAPSYTTLKIAIPNGDDFQEREANNYYAFGISGEQVYVLLKTNPDALGEDWIISNDTWGGTNGQNVSGITTGQVGSGAVILQKSADGYNWEFCSSGSYSNGIFTTNYVNEFGIEAETCIYTPSGQEVNQGYIYRIFYAYEIRNIKTNQYKNIVEMYTIKLINANIDAVTFHNLTLQNDQSDISKEGEDITVEIINATETLTDGAMTVTGFEIDTSLNSAVSIGVYRNGEPYTVPQDNKIVENGKYEIDVQNELGSQKHITLYVANMSSEEMYAKLFGDAFIEGKRIFSYDNLPVYEGGLTDLHLKGLGAYDSPTYITIKNETTGQTQQVNYGFEESAIILTDAGMYTVSVCTNMTYGGIDPSGDSHSFTFKFTLIANGTAPGPVVNKESLQNYSTNNNPSNAYPIYYGVSYLSASRGYITLAFANWQDAYEYVYDNEKGMVELQPDGSYRYNGSFYVSQKEKYTSGWELTDAIDFFTRLAIKPACFDLSDEFTYLTLTEELIESIENLRTLELDKSVVIFADEKQRDAILSNTGIPLINSKKYAYLAPGAQGEIERGYHHFEFVKDAYGYDSHSVTIIDSNGNRYSIDYNTNVADQLKAFGCSTGKIKIEEKTVYGDTNVYEALYIAELDNTISFDLKYYVGEKEYTKHISSTNNGEEIIVNLFYIDNVIDQLGDLGLIRVYDGKNESFYSTDNANISGNPYSDIGAYEISVVNRLGYKYTFTVKIETSNYYVIKIKGETPDDDRAVIYTDEDKVKLPNYTKYGYNHTGFKAEDGTSISKEVDSILLKGHTALEAVWEAKKFNVKLYVGEELYSTKEVSFGESYELPTLKSKEDATFVGWGDDLLTGTITLSEEGDVVLVANFQNQTGDSVDVDIGTVAEDTGWPWWVWVIIVVVVIIIIIGICGG